VDVTQNLTPLHDFSASALAEAIEANTIEFIADLGRSSQVTLYREPDVAWLATGMPYPSFNRVLHAKFKSEDVDARIEAALAPFKSRNAPMAWHTGPTTQPPELGEHLIVHGLECTSDEPGMTVDLQSLDDDAKLPPGVTIERVGDLAGLRAWCEIFTTTFGQPDLVEATVAVETEMGVGEHLWRRLYIGSSRGKPVATALLFLGAGVAGIHGVGTLPEARRQGIGRAMTVTPLLEARTLGYRVGILHASLLGVGVYRRLGFEEYCKLRRYVWSGEQRQRFTTGYSDAEWE
jgi:GNAT superfamily N-acetyltransferase